MKKYREVLAYFFWAILTTIVSWVSYSLFIKLFQTEVQLSILNVTVSVNIAAANALSWVCAVLFSFVVNKLFVFQSRSGKPGVVLTELRRFVSARIATGVVEMAAVPLLAAIGLNQALFGVDGLLSKVIVSLGIMTLNYLCSKLYVFKNTAAQS